MASETDVPGFMLRAKLSWKKSEKKLGICRGERVFGWFSADFHEISLPSKDSSRVQILCKFSRNLFGIGKSWHATNDDDAWIICQMCFEEQNCRGEMNRSWKLRRTKDVSILISCGFYTNLYKLRELVRILEAAFVGRTDVEKASWVRANELDSGSEGRRIESRKRVLI